MAKRDAGERAFTLLELINVLALAAVLGALGMYGAARYLHHARTAEAVDALNRIGAAAVRYYDASDGDQPAGTTPAAAHAMRHFPPSSRQSVPADPANVSGKKFASHAGDWAVSPWRDLDFAMRAPQSYAYSFESRGTGATAHATATAQGDLDGDGVVSTYRITISPDPSLTAHVAEAMERTSPEE